MQYLVYRRNDTMGEGGGGKESPRRIMNFLAFEELIGQLKREMVEAAR